MNDKQSHTPGPWSIGRHGQLVGANGKQIDTYGLGVAGLVTPNAEGVANAKLMQAAPELVEACLNAQGLYEAARLVGMDKQLPGFERCAKFLDETIAKATGEPK